MIDLLAQWPTYVVPIVLGLGIVFGVAGVLAIIEKMKASSTKNVVLAGGSMLLLGLSLVLFYTSYNARFEHYREQAQAIYGITLTDDNIAALDTTKDVAVGEFFSNDPTSVYIASTDETILVKAKKVANNKLSLYEIPTRGEAKELPTR